MLSMPGKTECNVCTPSAEMSWNDAMVRSSSMTCVAARSVATLATEDDVDDDAAVAEAVAPAALEPLPERPAAPARCRRARESAALRAAIFSRQPKALLVMP